MYAAIKAIYENGQRGKVHKRSVMHHQLSRLIDKKLPHHP